MSKKKGDYAVVRLQIRIPEKLKKDLESHCDGQMNYLSMTKFVLQATREKLKKESGLNA